MGVLYRHDKPTYDSLAVAQVEDAKKKLVSAISTS